MHCCAGKGCDQFFNERVAKRDARHYRHRGLDPNGRRIIELAGARGMRGKTVLEVGGGVGAIQLELLRAGATRATNVELSPAYEPYAAALLRDNGMDGRVERRILDFAEEPHEVEAADIVVLHRVVCCYPDYETLVGAAADHAHEQLLLTFPRDVWWMRIGILAVNLVLRLRRRAFRIYVHDPPSIIGVAMSHGLTTTIHERGLIWEMAAFART
jgi:hypothetical protein